MTKPRIRAHSTLGLLLGAVLVLTTACSDDGKSATSSSTRTTVTTTPVRTASYVGAVDGSDAYLGLVVGADGDALAYISNGYDSVDWLDGSATNESASLANDGGATLDVAFADGAASGTFTRPDSPPLQFRARPAGAPAGVYRATASFADGDYVGGWIVLADGSQRGAVRRYETPLPYDQYNGPLDLAHPAVTVPGGTLSATRVDPGQPLP